MGGEALPSDYELVKYFVEQGYGSDLPYIADETGIPYKEVVDHVEGMRAHGHDPPH